MAHCIRQFPEYNDTKLYIFHIGILNKMKSKISKFNFLSDPNMDHLFLLLTKKRYVFPSSADCALVSNFKSF